MNFTSLHNSIITQILLYEFYIITQLNHNSNFVRRYKVYLIFYYIINSIS